MPKIRSVPEEGSERVLVFDAKLERSGSGRGVSGLIGIHYGDLDADLRKHINNSLAAGKYKLVVQRKQRGRWTHVASAEIDVTPSPS